jgi:hypothetical protein
MSFTFAAASETPGLTTAYQFGIAQLDADTVVSLGECQHSFIEVNGGTVKQAIKTPQGTIWVRSLQPISEWFPYFGD